MFSYKFIIKNTYLTNVQFVFGNVFEFERKYYEINSFFLLFQWKTLIITYYNKGVVETNKTE